MTDPEDFKEITVKRLVGGDSIHAGPQFTFEPGHKLYIMTSHMPVIREGDGSSFWRRLRPIDPEKDADEE